jgi:uncharacterized membrane protein YbhN (UPF0104 family)
LNKNLKRFIKTILTIIVITLTLYFFGRTLIRNWEEVKSIGVKIDPFIASSLIFFSSAVIISGTLWGMIINRISKNQISLKEFSKIHISSWLLKYIPGQVGSFFRKLHWGNKNNLTKKVITASFIYENVFLIVSSLLLSIPIISILLFKDIQNNITTFLPLILVIPLIIGLFNRKVLFVILNKLLKFFNRKPIKKDLLLSNKNILFFIVSYALPRLINGLGFVLIAHSIIGITSGEIIPFIAIYTLAGIIGLLAIFVPSGIGVREGIIVLLLSNYTGTTEAVVISIYARFLSTISDIVLFIIYIILDKFTK